jgi:quinol monooxygenase YgiN
LRAAARVGQLPGCRMYAICEDLHNENVVWVMELWDDQQAHDASLGDEQVRALIAEARPLLGGAPDGAALRVVGGFGV